MGLIKKITKPIYDYIDKAIINIQDYVNSESLDVEKELTEMRHENAIMKEEILFMTSKDEYRLKFIYGKLLFFTRDSKNNIKKISLQLPNSYFSNKMDYQVEKYEKNELMPNTYALIISFKSGVYYERQAMFWIDEDCNDDIEASIDPIKLWVS